MKYALAVSALPEQFTASYVSVYSFRKYHPDASVLFFGGRPDAVLETLNVSPVSIELTNVQTDISKLNMLYTNNMVISLYDSFDAFIIADCDILFNKSIKDLVAYAIQTKKVIGSTDIVNNRLIMNKSLYIVPSNAVNGKIRGTILQSMIKHDIGSVLIDAYYPILIDALKDETLTIVPGISVNNTDKRIVHYSDGAWRNTPANDLWTKMGEELIDSLGR